MEPGGQGEHGPLPVAWDEAREVVALGLTLCAALMAAAPIVSRLIDGQLDRWAWNGTLISSTTPSVGVVILGAAVLVATTPAVDVAPGTRRAVSIVSTVITVLAVVLILDILFGPTAGGVREFFRRFPTILRSPLPTALMAGMAGWLGRRVVPFPGG
ncbi:MAG: hypothetical protein DHS20C19_06270 [Acidimicrobiales bacterium]|nr:MAG: hypothetical protein DHS20C19_06270 [Acidimicrobiales bacterium]